MRRTSSGKPPMRSAQRSPSSASSTHSREGVLMVSPRNSASLSWPPWVMRKSLGTGQGGVKRASRSTARGLRMSIPCAASPPMTFCQEYVTTSSFSHGRSTAKTADVASQMVRPVRSAAIHSPSGTFTPEVVPFHAKTTSRSPLIEDKSGSSPKSASKTRTSSICKCWVIFVAHPRLKLSQDSTSTPRAPNSDHRHISTAPVSEPGTTPMR